MRAANGIVLVVIGVALFLAASNGTLTQTWNALLGRTGSTPTPVGSSSSGTPASPPMAGGMPVPGEATIDPNIYPTGALATTPVGGFA